MERWAFSHGGRSPQFSSRQRGGTEASREQYERTPPRAQAVTEECGSGNLEVLVDFFPRRQASYIAAQLIPASGWLPPGWAAPPASGEVPGMRAPLFKYRQAVTKAACHGRGAVPASAPSQGPAHSFLGGGQWHPPGRTGLGNGVRTASPSHSIRLSILQCSDSPGPGSVGAGTSMALNPTDNYPYLLHTWPRPGLEPVRERQRPAQLVHREGSVELGPLRMVLSWGQIMEASNARPLDRPLVRGEQRGF